MKKIVLVLVLMISLSFSLHATAWLTLTINWSGSCVTPDNNAVYAITVKVWNSSTSQYVFTNTVQKSTGLPNSIQFDVTQCCTFDQEDAIFKIYVTVRKIRVSDGVILCQGHSESDLLNCEGLVNYSSQFNVALN